MKLVTGMQLSQDQVLEELRPDGRFLKAAETAKTIKKKVCFCNHDMVSAQRIFNRHTVL